MAINKDEVVDSVDKSVLKSYLKSIDKSLSELSKKDLKGLLKAQEDANKQKAQDAEERKEFINNLADKVGDQTKDALETVVDESFGSSKFVMWVKNALFSSIKFLKDEIFSGFKQTRDFLRHIGEIFSNGIKYIGKGLTFLGDMFVTGLAKIMKPIGILLGGIWNLSGKVFKFLTGTLSKFLVLSIAQLLLNPTFLILAAIVSILAWLTGKKLFKNIKEGFKNTKENLKNPKYYNKIHGELTGGTKSVKDRVSKNGINESINEIFTGKVNYSDSLNTLDKDIKTAKQPQVVKEPESKKSTNVITNDSSSKTYMNLSGASTAIGNTQGFNIGNPR